MDQVRYVDNDNREHYFDSKDEMTAFISRESSYRMASFKMPEQRRVRAFRMKDGQKVWLSGMGYINAGIQSAAWYTETDNEANAAIFMGTFLGNFTAEGNVFELEDVAN